VNPEVGAIHGIDGFLEIVQHASKPREHMHAQNSNATLHYAAFVGFGKGELAVFVIQY
jgi:hypothetical protein